MSELNRTRHARFLFPFTILSQPNRVHLVAGEDFRYSFEGKGIETWCPDFLAQIDGSSSLEDLLQKVPQPFQKSAESLFARLYQERILMDALALHAHIPQQFSLQLEGAKSFLNLFSDSSHSQEGEKTLKLLCQDSLDYQQCLDFNETCLQEDVFYLWLSTGAMNRAYLSPLFHPKVGPCLHCMLRQFQARSPFPEVYDLLKQHPSEKIRSTPFSEQGLQLLKSLTLLKKEWTQESDPPPTLYRLHVLEVSSLEVNTYRIRKDPECPSCLKYKH